MYESRNMSMYEKDRFEYEFTQSSRVDNEWEMVRIRMDENGQFGPDDIDFLGIKFTNEQQDRIERLAILFEQNHSRRAKEVKGEVLTEEEKSKLEKLIKKHSTSNGERYTYNID